MVKKNKKITSEEDVLFVDYVHRFNDKKYGSCPKNEFIEWAKKNNGFVFYKIMREYNRPIKISIEPPPEAKEIIEQNEETDPKEKEE